MAVQRGWGGSVRSETGLERTGTDDWKGVGEEFTLWKGGGFYGLKLLYAFLLLALSCLHFSMRTF